jgi:hypothetical protein
MDAGAAQLAHGRHRHQENAPQSVDLDYAIFLALILAVLD